MKNFEKKVDKNRHQYINELLKNFPDGRGVEVGVFKGEFSKHIVENWGGTLYMVDVWQPLDEKQYNDTSNHSQNEDVYEQAMKSIEGYEDRAIMIRTSSEIAKNLFQDGSLDFVYIDANHAYEFVKDDIKFWYPKVKSGGYLCGHDFLLIDWYADKNFTPNGKDKTIYFKDIPDKKMGVFGVNPAVMEFCWENNYDIEITNEFFSSWFLKKR
jgi:hypothetical protein